MRRIWETVAIKKILADRGIEDAEDVVSQQLRTRRGQ